jgi:hypothetical protein
MTVCTCPRPDALGDLKQIGCPESFGQTQKLAIWRGGKGNSIATVADMILAATWTDLFSAVDDTHTIVTPFIDNPVFEPGKSIDVGSGNEVRDGIPKLGGYEPTKFTFKISEATSDVYDALKALECEQLEVILVNQYNKFGHRLDGVLVKGFEAYGFRISDKKIAGFNGIDEHECSIYLKAEWSRKFTVTDPTANFNPLEWSDV